MTTIYLTNKDNEDQSVINPYYIEINAVKIEDDCASIIQKEINKADVDFGTDSVTWFIDLKQRKRVITIHGSIDRYSNRTSGWAASAVHDAGVVKKRLIWMWDVGGTVKIYVGTAADGYWDQADSGDENNIIEGTIGKIKFTEGGDDHIKRGKDSEDYPKSVNETPDKVAVVNKYDIILTLIKGTSYA